MHSNNPLGLLDVVCGQPADMGSVHRYVHGGALFCFCSDECLARFIVDPQQFVPGGRRGGPGTWSGRARRRAVQSGESVPVRATPPAAAVPSSATPIASSGANGAAAANAPVLRVEVPSPLAPVAAPAMVPPVANAVVPWPQGPVRAAPLVEDDVPPSLSRAVPTLGPIVVPSAGSGGFLASLFAWREKRYASRTCVDMLRLHKIVAARHPLLVGPPLYREVVAAHYGGDYHHADAVLENAEQSFAIWPVERPLKFADVVHYIAASELLSGKERAGRGIRADMKRIVATRIPSEL